MSETKPIKLQFAPLDPPTEPDPKNPGQTRERKQSPTLEIASGVYYRKFVAAEQPFEVAGTSHEEDGRTVVDVTPEEELQILLRDGHFVVVDDGKEREPESPAPKKNLGKIGGSTATAGDQVPGVN